MLLLSRVCAEFRDRTGNLVYRVTPESRLAFREAPESIREDPLFDLLLREGSLEAAVTPVRRKELEADPLEGTDPAGRKAPAAEGGGRTDAPGRKAGRAKVTANETPAG